MILTEKINIKIGRKNLNHFKNLGFDIKFNDEIEVKPGQLLKYCDKKIKIKCDECERESEIKYSHYNINCDRNGGLYYCGKCKNIRATKTNLKKYGVENVSQSKEIKEKKKETNLKNWGSENVFQNEIIKNISKKTKKEKYNDDHFTNREKSKKTCLMNT